MMREAKLLPSYFQKSRSPMGKAFQNFSSKRNFTSGFDRILGKVINKLPNGNVGYALVALNSLFYFIYLIWPRHQMYSFLNNFTFSKFNLSSGYLHTFFTCHFTHMSFLSYLLDTVILYLFTQNLMMMFGSLYVAKVALLSMFLGSFLLFL